MCGEWVGVVVVGAVGGGLADLSVAKRGLKHNNAVERACWQMIVVGGRQCAR